MDGSEFRKFQDRIFQEIRDLEDVEKQRDEESTARAKIVFRMLEDTAKKNSMTLEEFMRRVANGDPVGNISWDHDDKGRWITLAQWLQQTLPTLWKELQESK